MRKIIFVLLIIFLVGCQTKQINTIYDYPKEDLQQTDVCNGLEKGIVSDCLKEPTSDQCINLKQAWDKYKCDNE